MYGYVTQGKYSEIDKGLDPTFLEIYIQPWILFSPKYTYIYYSNKSKM